MAKISLRYNFSSVTNKVVCVVFAHSNPSAELADKRWVLDNVTPGLEKNGTHVVTGIKSEMHTIKFYESTDGATLETDLDCSVSIDASIYNEIIVQRYEYMVGRGLVEVDGSTDEVIWKDPADGDDQLIDTRLAGVTNVDGEVHLQGFGDLQSGQVTWLTDGGFSWADGKKFYQDERYIITRIVLVAQQVPEAQVTSDMPLRPLVDVDFTAGVVNFGPEFYGKRCPVNVSTQAARMVFGNFALIPDTVFEINTYQGNQIYFQFQFFSGNTVYFNGANRNILHFPKMEKCRLEFKSGVCYVTDYSGRVHERGQIIGDTQDRSISNAGPYLSCAEAGSPADGNIYTGLYEWITQLPADRVIDMTLWGSSLTNKMKWGLDTVNKTFRPPAVEGMHRRFRSGSEPAGTYVPNRVGRHRHKVWGQDNTAPVNPGGAVDEVGNVENAPPADAPVNPAWRWRWAGWNAKADNTVETQTENTVEAIKDIPLVVL